jgi:hypothetical protein
MFFVVEIETEKKLGLYDADTQIWPTESLLASPFPVHDGRPAAGYTVQLVVHRLSPTWAKDVEAVKRIITAAARKSNLVMRKRFMTDVLWNRIIKPNVRLSKLVITRRSTT